MAWICTVSEGDAVGRLKSLYDEAIRRAGKVFQILKVQSNNVGALQASLNLYIELFHKPSPLSRAQREMIAVVVSGINECHY